MRKFAVVVLPFALLMIVFAIAPVMAIGPDQASDVGNNPNLRVILGGLHNMRGEAGGSIIWIDMFDPGTEVYLFSHKWSFFDPTEGEGKMNNAVIADWSTLTTCSGDSARYAGGVPTVYENDWIFLSSEGSGNQYEFPDLAPYKALHLLGSHSMLWWTFYFGFGYSTDLANYICGVYPDGVFWKYNYYR